MSLTKAQLEALNVSSFPNNNEGLITPEILRVYNSSSIAATVNQDVYTTESASFSSRILAATGSGGGNVSVQDEGSILGTATSFNFTGAGVTATLSSGTASVTIPGGGTIDSSSLVTTASFNAYTQSTNTFTASISTSVGLLQTFSGSQYKTDSSSFDSRILAITASVPAGTVSSSAQIVAYNIFATTGSNTFTGNQTINANLTVSQSKSIIIGDDASIVTQKIGDGRNILTINSNKGLTISNATTGAFEISQAGPSKISISHIGGGSVELSGSSTYIQDVNFIPFSSSLNSRILAITASVPAGTVSSSAQIVAYNIFATTASVTASINTLSSSIYQTDATQSYQITANALTASNSTTALSQSLYFTDTTQSTNINSLTALTSSYVRNNQNNTYSAGTTQSFDYITAGTASITYLSVIYETSSVIYSSGSNILGDEANVDTQTLVGRVIATGSLEVTGSTKLNGITTIKSTNGTPLIIDHSDASPTQNTLISILKSGSAEWSLGNLGTDDSFILYNPTTFQTPISVAQNNGVTFLGNITASANISSSTISGIGNVTLYSASVAASITGSSANVTLLSASIYQTDSTQSYQITANALTASNATTALSQSLYFTDTTQSNNISSNSSSIGLLQTFSGSQYKNDSASFSSRILAVTGSSINTGSFATTGSNSFVGDQTITGSLFVSGGNGVAVDIGYDVANTGLGVSFSGNQISSNITAANPSFSQITLAVYDDNYNYDNEFLLVASSSSIEFKEYNQDIGDYNYRTWMKVSASNGSGIKPIQLLRNTEITGSLKVSGSTNFTELTGSLATFSASVNTRINNATGSGGNVSVQDEGTILGNVTSFNFNGAGVTASVSAGTASITIAGGGGSIDTGSFATTGSNSFVGNQRITGSLTISSSVTTDLVVIGRQIITGSAGNPTGRTSLAGTSVDVDTTQDTGTGAFLMAIASTGSQGAALTLGVYDSPNFNTDIELNINVDTGSGILFNDFDNVSAFNYVPFMSVAPNLGTNPRPVMTRGLVVTGSASFTELTGSLASYSSSVNSRLLAATGSTINTASFATTGSNTFTGNQNISGDVTASIFLATSNGSTAFIYNQQSTGSVAGVYNTNYGKDSLQVYQYQSQPYAFCVNLTANQLNAYTGSEFQWGLLTNGTNSIPGGGSTYFAMMSGSTITGSGGGADKVGLDYLGTAMIMDFRADTSFKRKVYVDKGMYLSQSVGGGIPALIVNGTSAASSKAIVATGSVNVTGSINLNGTDLFLPRYGSFTATAISSSGYLSSYSQEFAIGVEITSGSRLNVTESGYYQVSAQVNFDSTGSSDDANIYLAKNGTGIGSTRISTRLQNSSVFEGVNTTALVQLNANEYIEVGAVAPATIDGARVSIVRIA